MKTMHDEKEKLDIEVEAFENGESKNLSWAAAILIACRNIKKILDTEAAAIIFAILIVFSVIFGIYKFIHMLVHSNDEIHGNHSLHYVIEASQAVINKEQGNYSWLNQDTFISLPSINKEELHNEFSKENKDNNNEIIYEWTNDLNKEHSVFKGFELNYHPVRVYPAKDGKSFFVNIIKQDNYICPYEIKELDHIKTIRINGEIVNFKDKKDIYKKCNQGNIDILYEFQ